MFEKMDEQLLDALCDRLKPALFTENSFIIREGDPVSEMLFLMRGTLLTMTTNGGRTGFFNSASLKAGDFCGEELLTWALDPHSSTTLPSSTRTVKAVIDVEAFALTADDLKFVAAQFRRLHSKQIRHTFRYVHKFLFNFRTLVLTSVLEKAISNFNVLWAVSGSIHSIGGHGQPASYKQHGVDTAGTSLRNL